MRNEHPVLFSLPMIQAHLRGIKTMTRRIIGSSNSLVDGNRVTPKQWKGYEFDFSNAYIDNGPSPAGNPGPYLKGVYSKLTDAHHRIYPLYQTDDLLYVRESWQLAGWNFEDGECTIRYAGGTELTLDMEADELERWTEWLTEKIHNLEGNGIFKAKANDAAADHEEHEFIRTEKSYPMSPGIHLPKWGSRIWDEVITTKPQRVQEISEEDAVKEGMAIFDNDKQFIDQSAKTRFNILWNNMHPGSWHTNDFIWATELKVLSTEGKPLFKKLSSVDAEGV